MISISKNFSQFKKGILDTCNLFKIMYQDNRNIICDKDNTLYINNIDQLLDFKTNNYNEYKFGVQYVLDNIKNLRENICLNPTLYVSAIETLFNKVFDVKEFEKYKNEFNKVSDFLLEFYNLSGLNKTKINISDIYELLNEEVKDNFLKQVIDNTYSEGNIEIEESKSNYIVKHKYYTLKGRLLSGQIYGENYNIYLNPILDKNNFTELVNKNIPILVLCSHITFDLNNSYGLTIINLPNTTFYQNYEDICMLTGAYANNLGHIKEFKFVDGKLQFSVDDYLLSNDTRLIKHKEKDLKKYYMLQGKNKVIYAKEEYLEKVRNIVSLVKSLTLNGIFYDRIKTLKLLAYNFKDNLILSIFLNDLLINYLKLCKADYNIIEQIIKKDDLKLNFDVKTKAFTDKCLFEPLDYYTNIFNLLDSNINTLYKLY